MNFLLQNLESNLAKSDYLEYDKSLRYKRLRIGILLSVIFFPIFSFLDFFVYSNIFYTLLNVRISTTIILVMLFFLCNIKLFNTGKIISFFWVIILFISLNMIIFLTKDVASPYYAGLNLIIVGLSVLLPWSIGEAILSCLFMLFSYVITLYFMVLANDIYFDYIVLLRNAFFLFTTSTICVVASYFNSKLRFKEFSLNNDLKILNKKLVKMDDLKSQFFANVSHEFRTPLTLIIGPVQDILASGQKLPEKIYNIFDIVKQNSSRLLRLVNNLLDVIKLEENKMNLDFQKIAINDLIAATTDSMIYNASLSNVTLKKNINKDDIFINVDKFAIEKIILNLISNAIKFTKANGVIIINTKVVDNKYIIEVIDNGIGIAEQDIELIFDRFHQVDGSNTKKHQGTGIGLALVKELVQLQRGGILVESKIGKGSKFILQFSLYNNHPNKGNNMGELGNNISNVNNVELGKQDNDNQRNYSNISHNTRNVNYDILQEIDEYNKSKENCPKIMVIDDEYDMLRYVVNILIDENKYYILHADEGKLGLKEAKNKIPEIIILDLMLPNISGLEICQKLKNDKKTRGIKIILLTAKADEETKIRALNYGADDFITKPFNSTEVKSKINNIVENSRLQNQIVESNNKLNEALKELKITQDQLIHNHKINAIGSLSAGLLHEVNNPVNYILLALQLLKTRISSIEDDKIHKVVNDMQEGVDRIKNIINGLKDFAYPEQSHNKKEFLLYDIIEQSLKFTSSDAKNIKRINNIDKNMKIFGSPMHISQLFVNLFNNAAKAIGINNLGGEIKIYVEEKGEEILVFVEDNGSGMDKETLSRVFDPFFTTSDVRQGMGLGLSICHTIMKAHGGKINIESEVNQGTKFTFNLKKAQNI